MVNGSMHYILSSEEIKTLRPDERETYIKNVVKDILDKKKNGVSISDVVELTGFTRITIGKHLQHLASIREAYKKETRGGAIFFKNGRLVHPTGQSQINVGNKVFAFYRLENDDGEFFYIQEKEEDIYKALKVKGGIMIPVKHFQSFLDGLIGFTLKSKNPLEEIKNVS